MPRTFRRAAAAALCLVVCLGAGVNAWAESSDGVTVVAPWRVSGVEPSYNGYLFQRMGVAETLVDASTDGTLRPGLATRWAVSADGRRWTFRLRDGVSFHDGTPLTAQAASASLRRALHRPGVLRSAPITGIAAEDGAVAFMLDEPFAALPSLLANYTTVILAPASFDETGAVIRVVGTGAFRVESVEAPASLRIRRFPGYWGKAPAIERARYVSVRRAETRALMVERGDADVAMSLDPAGYTRLSRLEGVATKAVSIPRVLMVKLNLSRPALAEPEARRALSLAIDRRRIAAGILRFPGAAATQLFPPVLADWHDATVEALAHDTGKARELLTSLGWQPGEDGILERDGERFTLTLRTFPNRPELPLIAAALRAQWRRIGVEVDVSVGDPSDIPAGHRNGSLDVALYARNYGLTPNPLVTAIDDFANGGGDWGAMSWHAPAVSEALRTATATRDPAQRRIAIDAVVEALQAELPVLPIAWYQHTLAHDAALSGVILDPLERSYGLSRLRWRVR